MMNWTGFLISLLFSCIMGNSSLNNRPTIHWYAPFYSGGGYCSEAISFISILSNFSYPLCISQHGDSINQNYIQNMRIQEKELLDSKYTRGSIPNEISICHSEPGAWSAPYPHYQTQQCPPPNAGYKIGRTMFETDRIPSGWVSRLNYMDEVWVPTEFARQIFLREGVDEHKVHIIAEPIDTEFYSYGISELSNQKRSKFRNQISKRLVRQQTNPLTDATFIYLFIGKWEYRKGVQLLLKAFLNEFNQSYSNSINTEENREDVALIIVTSAYHSTSDFFNAIIHELLDEKVVHPSILLSSIDSSSSLTLDDLQPHNPITQLLRRVVLLTDVPQDDMPTLYQLSNTLVIPSRGEGWGRPHVEAMSCGLPIIATNWSGVTAYLTEANGYPLMIDKLIEARGWKGHQWAEPSLTHLQYLLRYTFTHPEETALKGKQARQDMIDHYSYRAFSEELRRHFMRIERVIHEKRTGQSIEL